MNISKRLPNCSPKWVDHGNSALDHQFSKGMLHLVGLSWGYWRIPWILENGILENGNGILENHAIYLMTSNKQIQLVWQERCHS